MLDAPGASNVVKLPLVSRKKPCITVLPLEDVPNSQRSFRGR
jgi:hypothetical protein